jgi:hypothetical protein
MSYYDQNFRSPPLSPPHDSWSGEDHHESPSYNYSQREHSVGLTEEHKLQRNRPSGLTRSGKAKERQQGLPLRGGRGSLRWRAGYDYSSFRPSSSSHGDSPTEVGHFHSQYSPPQRDNKGYYMPRRGGKRGNREGDRRPPNLDRPQYSHLAASVEDTYIDNLPFSSRLSVHERATSHSNMQTNLGGYDIPHDRSKFVQPDRARMMAPTDERGRYPDKRNWWSRSESVNSITKRGPDTTRWDDEQQTSARTPVDRTRIQSHSPKRNMDSCRLTPSRNVNEGLSAADGHQWTKDIQFSNRGRGKTRGHDQGGRGRTRQHGDGRQGRHSDRTSVTPAPCALSPSHQCVYDKHL